MNVAADRSGIGSMGASTSQLTMLADNQPASVVEGSHPDKSFSGILGEQLLQQGSQVRSNSAALPAATGVESAAVCEGMSGAGGTVESSPRRSGSAIKQVSLNESAVAHEGASAPSLGAAGENGPEQLASGQLKAGPGSTLLPSISLASQDLAAASKLKGPNEFSLRADYSPQQLANDSAPAEKAGRQHLFNLPNISPQPTIKAVTREGLVTAANIGLVAIGLGMPVLPAIEQANAAARSVSLNDFGENAAGKPASFGVGGLTEGLVGFVASSPGWSTSQSDIPGHPNLPGATVQAAPAQNLQANIEAETAPLLTELKSASLPGVEAQQATSSIATPVPGTIGKSSPAAAGTFSEVDASLPAQDTRRLSQNEAWSGIRGTALERGLGTSSAMVARITASDGGTSAIATPLISTPSMAGLPGGLGSDGAHGTRANPSPVQDANLFTQMDSPAAGAGSVHGANAGLGSATVLHASSREMGVGIQDPQYGWVEVKAQMVSGQVSASLSAATVTASHALQAQLPAMANYLAQREVDVANLAMASHAAGGEGGMRGQGSHAGGREQSSQPQPVAIESVAPSRRSVTDDPQQNFYGAGRLTGIRVVA